jgi:hypothetical protein
MAKITNNAADLEKIVRTNALRMLGLPDERLQPV